MLFPGVGALCGGRNDEGAGLMALGLAELSLGLGAGLTSSFANPSASLPLLAFADLYTATALDGALRAQRARRLPFVPQESVPEVLGAPFDPAVLRDPVVWGGVLGTLSAALLYTRLVDGPFDTRNAGTRPVVFGKTLDSAVGYPLGLAMGAGLFTHVAAAEELAFRGLVQSAAVRAWGEAEGWVAGTLVFGLFHSSNVLFLAPDQRVDYLVKAVPFITLLGGYLGWAYRERGYGLQAPAAVHFWYDFLLEAISFALDPKNSPLAMTFAF